MTESQLQQQIISYLSSISRRYNFIFFSPMNEAIMMVLTKFRVPQKTIYMIMSWMGKMGFLAGLSDIMIGWHGRLFCMELKTPTGKQSKGQILFEANCKKTGIEYQLCRSFEECQRLMVHWGIV